MSKRIVIAILALFMAGVAFAQLVPTAKMEGKVADSTGAPLPGVSVEATSPRLVGKAMIGGVFFRFMDLIFLVALTPSISGIWISMKMRS